jgi:hypothetical protein
MEEPKKYFLNKYALILVVILAVVMIVLAVRFVSGGDTWICKNGQWVKHGNPSLAAPTAICK